MSFGNNEIMAKYPHKQPNFLSFNIQKNTIWPIFGYEEITQTVLLTFANNFFNQENMNMTG